MWSTKALDNLKINNVYTVVRQIFGVTFFWCASPGCPNLEYVPGLTRRVNNAPSKCNISHVTPHLHKGMYHIYKLCPSSNVKTRKIFASRFILKIFWSSFDKSITQHNQRISQVFNKCETSENWIEKKT